MGELADHDASLTPSEGEKKGRLGQMSWTAMQPKESLARPLVSSLTVGPQKYVVFDVLDMGAAHGKHGLSMQQWISEL